MDNKFNVKLQEINNFDLSTSENIHDINNYNDKNFFPLKFSSLQFYYPTLDIFNIEDFSDNQKNFSICTKRQILNHNTVFNSINNSNENADIFFKFAPLLDLRNW